MSTPNYKQGVNVFFVSEEQHEDWEWYDLKDYIRDEIDKKYIAEIEDETIESGRSYPVFSFQSARVYCKKQLGVSMKIQWTYCPAYYSGVSFDVFHSLHIDGEEVTMEELKTNGEPRLDIVAWYEEEVRKLIKRTRSAYKHAGLTEIMCMGVFNNGEAVYKKVGK